MIKQIIKFSFLLGLLIAVNTPGWTEDNEDFQDAPQPPVLPDPVESGEPIEPEITIIQKEDATIEEYRVNGNLYMVKVIPVVGPSYYLLDKDGDGRLESRLSELYNDVLVPQWVLFEW